MADIPTRLKQEKALEYVMGVFQDLKTQRIPFDTKWPTRYKQYKSISHKKFYEGKANLFVPETFNAIEANVANQVQSLLPTPDFFALKPRQRDDVEQSELNTELIKYELEKGAFKTQLIKALRQGGIYGTIILCVPWEYREENRKFRKWYNEDISNVFGRIIGSRQASMEEERDSVVYEGPTFEVVPIQDFYINVRKSIDTANEIIRTQELTFDQLKALEASGMYFNVDRAKDEDYHESDKIDNISEVQGLDDKPIGPEVHRVQLKHFWGNYKFKKKVEPVVITVANDKYIIRMEQNRFYNKKPPYIATPYQPIEDEFYGMGIPELLESLQVELNDTRNQIMDSKTFNLCRMWKRLKGAGILSSQLKTRPNGVIDVESMGDLEELTTNTMAESSGYQAESVIKEDMRRTAKAMNNQQGLPSKFKTSATEVRAMAAGGDVGNKLTTEWLEETLIKPVIERIYDYNQQFISSEMTWGVLGQQKSSRFFSIKPAQIGRTFDVVPLGSSITESRAVQQQQIINFFNIASKVPPEIARINYQEILKRIWEGFGFRNAKDIVTSNDPQAVIMQMLETMVQQGVQPQQAFQQMRQAVMQAIQTAVQQMQQGAKGSTGSGGQGQAGAPAQEQPQPLNEVDAARSSNTIRGL